MLEEATYRQSRAIAFHVALELLSGVRSDPRAPKRVMFMLSVRPQGYLLLVFGIIYQVHMNMMNIGFQMDRIKRAISVILKAILGLISSFQSDRFIFHSMHTRCSFTVFI